MEKLIERHHDDRAVYSMLFGRVKDIYLLWVEVDQIVAFTTVNTKMISPPLCSAKCPPYG